METELFLRRIREPSYIMKKIKNSCVSVHLLVLAFPVILITVLIYMADMKFSSRVGGSWFWSSTLRVKTSFLPDLFLNSSLSNDETLSIVTPCLPKETLPIHGISSPLDQVSDNMTTLAPESLQSVEELNNSVETVGADTLLPKIEKRYSKIGMIELGLARIRSAIREAGQKRNATVPPGMTNYIPRGPIYWNSDAFLRSYMEMEKHFKIYVYEEGEPPLFHNGPGKSIYSTEGTFIHEMEVGNQFRTRDPERAHVFFLPFSVVMMVRYIYTSNSHDISSIRRTVIDYVNIVSEKYPYWNRSLGADHLILSCHDWGPMVSGSVPYLYNHSIRVLCNANISEGFNPSKDVSLPEINLVTGDLRGFVGGNSPSLRSILAFFAGGMHGPIRPVLLRHWKGKDNDIQVYEYLPKNIRYYDMMKKSKYCICPSGYEVASPRIVEAIYTECVPVTISESYSLPFSDVLNWKSFSVQVSTKDIPNLKNILMGISQNKYLRLYRRVKQVKLHFMVNNPPKKYDLFHMIMHSVWLRRLNVHIHD